MGIHFQSVYGQQRGQRANRSVVIVVLYRKAVDFGQVIIHSVNTYFMRFIIIQYFPFEGCWRWVSTQLRESENRTRRKSSVRCPKTLLVVTWLSTLSATSGKRLGKRKSIVIDPHSATYLFIRIFSPLSFPTSSSFSKVIKAVTSSLNTDLELKEVRIIWLCLRWRTLLLLLFWISWSHSETSGWIYWTTTKVQLISRSTEPRTISTGWDKITKKSSIGFSAPIHNTSLCDGQGVSLCLHHDLWPWSAYTYIIFSRVYLIYKWIDNIWEGLRFFNHSNII